MQLYIYLYASQFATCWGGCQFGCAMMRKHQKKKCRHSSDHIKTYVWPASVCVSAFCVFFFKFSNFPTCPPPFSKAVTGKKITHTHTHTHALNINNNNAKQ